MKQFAAVVTLYATSMDDARQVIEDSCGCVGNAVHFHSFANQGDGTLISAPAGSVAIDRARFERLLAVVRSAVENNGLSTAKDGQFLIMAGDLDPIP